MFWHLFWREDCILWKQLWPWRKWQQGWVKNKSVVSTWRVCWVPVLRQVGQEEATPQNPLTSGYIRDKCQGENVCPHKRAHDQGPGWHCQSWRPIQQFRSSQVLLGVTVKGWPMCACPRGSSCSQQVLEDLWVPVLSLSSATSALISKFWHRDSRLEITSLVKKGAV